MKRPAVPADPSTVPFPVELPYRVRADLARLDDRDAPLPRFGDDAVLRDAKRAALRRRPARVRVPDPARGAGDLALDVAAVLPALSALRPDVVRAAARDTERGGGADAGVRGGWQAVDPDGRRWCFPRLDASDPLLASPSDDSPDHAGWRSIADALALSLPEDLVWVRDDGGAGRASLLHVAFPSRWAPERRAGASLTELHGPVADGDALRAAGAALMRAIVAKGPFRRHVWSLAPAADLDLHPRSSSVAERNEPWAVDAAWFRVEIQTTLPMPHAGTALFTIRLRIAPLRAVLSVDPRRAGRLAASIRSMSPALRRYKDLEDGTSRLLEELDAWR